MSHVKIFLLDTQMLKLPPRVCLFGGCRQFILLNYILYISYLFSCVWELVHKWKPKDNLPKSVHSFHHMGSRLELRSSGLVKAIFFTHWAISPTPLAHIFHAVNQGWQTFFSKDQVLAVLSKLCHHHASAVKGKWRSVMKTKQRQADFHFNPYSFSFTKDSSLINCKRSYRYFFPKTNLNFKQVY